MSSAEAEVPDDPIRERLLAAAAEVFGEVGYDRAGVQEIARRAGFSTGTIYGRFRGKADLLLAAIKAESHNEIDELFARPDAAEHAGDILAAVGSHLVVDKFDTHQGLLLEAFVAARREPELARMLSQLIDDRAAELTRMIDDAKAAGTVDPSLDSFSVARFCHAVGCGFLLFGPLGLEHPRPEPWEELIRRLVEAVSGHGSGPPHE